MLKNKIQETVAPIKNDSIAQGAIEYLLMIGAAILVVAVVVIAITSITQSTPTNNTEVQIINDPLLLKTYEARGFTAMRVSGGKTIFTTYVGTEDVLKEDLDKRIENGVITNFLDGQTISPNSQLSIQIIDPEEILAIYEEVLELEDFTEATNGYTQITTCQEFFNINNNLSEKYLLMEDITLTKNCDGTTPLDTMVIGTFTGEIDGLGHTLKYQMQITNPIPTTKNLYYGLIYSAGSSAKIKNIKIEANVNNTLDYTYYKEDGNRIYTRPGGFIGHNGGLVENITFTGNVSGHTALGGLIAYNTTSGIVKNITMNGTVSTYAGSTVGGITAYNYGIIQNSTNNAEVTSKTGTVGGIAANNYSLIENATNNGNITTPGYDVSGGIAGVNAPTTNNNGVIKNSTNNGDISGRYYVGGILGSATHSVNKDFNSIIEGSTNNGTITGTTYTGGISGRIYYSTVGTYNKTIILKNNTNNGTITGTQAGYLSSIISKDVGTKNPKDAMKYLHVSENTNTNNSVTNCISLLYSQMDINFEINITNINTCS